MSSRPVADKPAKASRIPLLLIVVILITLITYLQWPESKQETRQFKREVPVKLTPVNLAEFIDDIEAVGTARANEQVLLTSQHANIISDVYFDDGQFVNKGDILVQFTNQEELAKVSELEANLSESNAQLTRLAELLSRKATSNAIVDQQSAKTKAIDAQLVSARSTLAELMIRAPFTGVLGFREVSHGAYINSGDVITSLDDLSVIKVDFFVPERLLTSVAIGQQVSVTNAAYKNEQFLGHVSAVDSRIDTSTRMVKVRANVHNKQMKLRPGMLLNINVLLNAENTLQLPERAIIPIEKKHYVFVVIAGKAVRKTVFLGRRKPGVVEVVAGLEAGEEVVVDGALKLREGSLVKVIATEKKPKMTSDKGV